MLENNNNASQQTASLQKQHREESVKLIRRVREFYQNDIVDLQKQLEEQREELQRVYALVKHWHKRSTEMEETLKECKRLVTIDRSGRSGNRLNEVSEIVDKALQSPPGESEKENNNHGKK